MAADEHHYIAPNSDNFPNGPWWVDCVGLKDDKLFVCFRNGDCAIYQTDVGVAQGHLANLLGTNHPGRYVNLILWGIPYIKAACPCYEISIVPGTDCLSAPTVPVNTPFYFLPPTGPMPAESWLRAFSLTGPFTAVWVDTNPPQPDIMFSHCPLDNSCLGIIGLGTGNTPFSGNAGGTLHEILLQYPNPNFAATAIQMTIAVS